MLQLTKINQILTQGLTAVPLQTSGETSLLVSPIAISLLFTNGTALSTVYSDLGHLTIDDIKVYLLLVYNYFKNINDGSDWGLLQIDKNINIAIEQVSLGDEVVKEHNDTFYVVILYNNQLPDSIAKLKLDNLITVLQSGLEGFK